MVRFWPTARRPYPSPPSPVSMESLWPTARRLCPRRLSPPEGRTTDLNHGLRFPAGSAGRLVFLLSQPPHPLPRLVNSFSPTTDMIYRDSNGFPRPEARPRPHWVPGRNSVVHPRLGTRSLAAASLVLRIRHARCRG